MKKRKIRDVRTGYGNYPAVPGEVPAWLKGVAMALLFGLVIFGDAIIAWLS